MDTKIHSTKHDIARCEQGLAPILNASCPCGGALFGAQRGNGPAFFTALPESDPHSFMARSDGKVCLKRPKKPSMGHPGSSSTCVHLSRTGVIDKERGDRP